MKKAIIKALSVMLVVVMTLTSAPLSGFVGLQLPEWLDFSIMSSAATSGKCGNDLTWTYDDSTGTLTISGTGDMFDYNNISGYIYSHPWISYEDSINNVVINDGVATIGKEAFYHCKSLTSVTIPDSVTTIGKRAFYDCDSLTSVTIPDSVTTIGEDTFYGCGSLTSVIIPDSVTTIGNDAFRFCRSLINVTIPDSVTTIGNSAFYYCTSLTSVTIGDSVITIGEEAFSWCYSLTSLTVDSNNQYYSSDEYGVLFNKDKTTLIQYPIGNTRTSYTIPDSATTIGVWAFANCYKLTSVTIPDSVTTIGVWAFTNCYKLTSVTIPDSVTTIGNYAFAGCDSLKDVYFSCAKAQWEKISIGSYNDPLLNATIHYNYHIHKYDSAVIPPTCTEQGYTTYTCECGNNYVDNYVDALSHTDGDIVEENYVAPTCTATGSKDNVTYCTVCNAETSRKEIIIDATGHNYTTEITSQTCTTQGYTTYTCSVCGDTYKSDYVDALGHTDGEIVEENYVAPTCTETGSKDNVTYCTVCNAETSRKEIIIDALGHNYTTEITSPTCTDRGYTTYTCSVCGDTYKSDYVDALGHTDGEIVEENYVAPTCTEIGGKDNVTYCTVCNAETSRKEIIIDALGHTEEEIPAVAPTCTENGLTAGVKCSVCGEILTAQQEILANGHKYESVVTAPTCTEQGYTTYTCACGDSYVDDYTDSLGHDFENGTCTECSATDPDYFTFSIQEPSTKQIRCNDGIVLHANIEGTLPQGARIEWKSSNSNFNINKSDSGKEITIISKNNGYTTFTTTVYDADNNVIAEDTIEMYSKAGFFDKLGGFFRSLFGTTKIYEN